MILLQFNIVRPKIDNLVTSYMHILHLGPNGELLVMLMGEGHGKLMKLFVSEALSLFKEENSISNHPIPEISHSERVDALHVLRYPGKIAVLNNPDNVLLAVADTGNHRILIMSESGAIMVRKLFKILA